MRHCAATARRGVRPPLWLSSRRALRGARLCLGNGATLSSGLPFIAPLAGSDASLSGARLERAVVSHKGDTNHVLWHRAAHVRASIVLHTLGGYTPAEHLLCHQYKTDVNLYPFGKLIFFLTLRLLQQ